MERKRKGEGEEEWRNEEGNEESEGIGNMRDGNKEDEEEKGGEISEKIRGGQ